jgi:hypothetical protein
MNIFEFFFGSSEPATQQPAVGQPSIPDANESAFDEAPLTDDDVIEFAVSNPDTGATIEVDANGGITQVGYDNLVATLESKAASGEWTPILKRGGQIGKTHKKEDIARIGKPVGDRFKTEYAKRIGKSPYQHPTNAEVEKAKKKGKYGTGKDKHIYSENRKNRSDKAPITKHFEDGGKVKQKGKGGGSDFIKKVQPLAKQIKADNPGMKWTECIKQASAQLKGKN